MGDSITGYASLAAAEGWGNLVNDYFHFKTMYKRSIGGSAFQYGTNGGAIGIVNETTGEWQSENFNISKDDYTGTVPAGCVVVRQALSSWDRITHMIPDSIRNTVDMVYVMGGTNGTYSDAEAAFVENDTTDAEWATSTFYSQIGGDYNISTLAGGLASCLMKMQLWCPNAVIIVGTPLSGRGTQGVLRTTIKNQEYLTAKVIRDVAAALSFPVIDVNGRCGINGWNAMNYLGDGTHPTTVDSKMMLARAVIDGLRNVIPKFTY